MNWDHTEATAVADVYINYKYCFKMYFQSDAYFGKDQELHLLHMVDDTVGFGFFSFNLKLFCGYCLFPVFINRLAVF